jgi:hypothetical protein
MLPGEKSVTQYFDPELTRLLRVAELAAPSSRIQYRDAIAAFGAQAIDALEAWLYHEQLAPFAIRTIGRAAVSDGRRAVQVLRAAQASSVDRIVQGDLRLELERLGATRPLGPRTVRASENPTRQGQFTVDDLVVGTRYKRGDLHRLGLGGNVQKGISYPADGDHVLLFSSPARIAETGYRDRWEGDDTYTYFGEWDGPGDMRLEKGNLRIVERSPRLFLFVLDHDAYRYQGQFAHVAHKSEATQRQAVRANAIVFTLRRVL